MRRALVYVGFGAAVILAGCAGADSGAESGRPHLTYWATNMAPTVAEDEAILEPRLAEFTERTGIEVDLEVVTWDVLWNRLLTAVSSGVGPDVANIGTTWSASLQATGGFRPFDDEALDAVGGAEAFLPAALGSTGADGSPPVAVPLYAQVYGLYYNLDLFEAAGIGAPPQTWNDFVDAARLLTRDTDGDGSTDHWGLALTAGSPAINTHLAFILGRQHGGTLFSDDGAPAFDSPEQVAAVASYIGLMAGDHVVIPSSAEFVRGEGANALADGQVAMVLSQSSLVSHFAALGFDGYGVAAPPVLDPLPPGGRDVRSMVGGINVGILAGSDEQDAALQLVRFLTAPEQQAELNAAYGTLPVVHEAYTSGAFDDPRAQVFSTVLREYAEPFPQVADVGQAEQELGSAVAELFARAATGGVVGADDVRAALREAGSAIAAR